MRRNRRVVCAVHSGYKGISLYKAHGPGQMDVEYGRAGIE